MINLNLLPPKIQLEVRENALFRTIKNITLLASILTVVSGAIIFGTYFWLSYQLSTTQNKLTAIKESQGNQTQSLEEAIDSVNAKATGISVAQKTDLAWSHRLRELLTQTPTGVTISSLVLDVNKKNLAIAGNAATRDELLTFESLIKAADYFDSVQLPISSLAQQRDIDFSLTAGIK